ncbi:hypothetical protein HMI54_010928 [Coelomomyces lativittatus]|nr:hypothetical protein HMI54_010928 [Coelomomyces lativittatus]
MEVGLRDQLERITKESRLLKQKAEVLEKENALLKKSIFDLSLKYNAIAYQQAIHPIELDDGSLKLMNPTNLDSGVITQKALLLETMASGKWFFSLKTISIVIYILFYEHRVYQS